MSAAAIVLTQVVVCAGERTIINAVDLTIRHGERVAIVGRNGAGKSTLLRLLTGMLQPVHGEVKVLDCVLRAKTSESDLRRLRAQIGQVFQGLHLVQRLTTLENVLVGGLGRNRSWLSLARIFSPGEVSRAEAALQSVGLIGKAHLRADRLSGGERQKVAVARMLMQSPRLILADEPTAALDPMAASDIAELLSKVGGQDGTTLLSVVHDPELLPILAERVLGMRDGRIVFDLPAAAVDADCLSQLYRDDPSPSDRIVRLERTPSGRFLDAPVSTS